MKFTFGNVVLYLDEQPSGCEKQKDCSDKYDKVELKYLNLISNHLFMLTNINSKIDQIEAGFVITGLSNYCLHLLGDNLIVGCGKKCILIGQCLDDRRLSQFDFVHTKAMELFKEEILYFVNNEKIHQKLKHRNIYTHFTSAYLMLK